MTTIKAVTQEQLDQLNAINPNGTQVTIAGAFDSFIVVSSPIGDLTIPTNALPSKTKVNKGTLLTINADGAIALNDDGTAKVIAPPAAKTSRQSGCSSPADLKAFG